MRALFTLILSLGVVQMAFTQIPCNGEFLNTGTAIDVGSCIQLTSATTGQQGCTWLNTPVDFSMPFTHSMIMNFGNSDAGADGICLVYQTNGPSTCGMTGGAIGAAGIPNSFIVEFDTWDNGALQSDIAPDHCATSIWGDLNNQIDPPVSLGNIEDGADHTVTFSWNPAGTSYTISFDGIPIITGVYDIINLVFFGNPIAYWGYTSSTGAAFNTQSVCPSLPPPINVDAGIDLITPCADGLITLDGTGTDFGATYVYNWSSPDGGVIVSGGGTLTPTVMGPGTYILTLTDLNGNCVETDEVVVMLNPIEAVIAPPPFVPCFGSTVFLDGSGSTSGPFISYQWTTVDGVIVSGANSPVVEIAFPGTYTLTVTYNDGNVICTETTSVQTIQDPNVPTAFAIGGEINCFFPIIQLDASGSSTGSDYTYQWTTVDGMILSGANTQFPTVGAAGTYTLIVTNNFNGCFATYDVVVTDNTSPPVAVANVADSLGCQVLEVVLFGTGSSMGANITYSWTTADGNIVSGADGLFPIVNQAGTYTLIVSDDSNGCFDTENVIVVGGATPLNIDIAPADLLTCDDPQATLDATASDQDATHTYQWSTADGNIVSGDNTLTPLVDEPGTYVLLIESADGCEGTSSIVVDENTTVPTAEAGMDQALSCDQPNLVLNGAGSSTGGNIQYEWFTTDGNIVSGSSSINPTVDAPGIYYLQVTNNSNGCFALDSLEILNDAAAPTVIIAPADTLDCNTLSATLDGSSSSQGPGFNFVWTTSDGSFVSGQNSLQPEIDAPGTYTLSITDLNNNCTTTSNLTVFQDITSPSIDIDPIDTLDCATDEVNLDASSSSQGSNFTYDWSTSTGNISSGGNTPVANVDIAASYQLVLTNTTNGCTQDTTVQVFQDTISPFVEILVADTLDCVTDSLVLDASNSSQGNNYAFSWSAPAPQNISNTNTLQPTANGGGTYGLTILNLDNSCQATNFVNVVQDTILPIADAGPDMIINCYNPTQILDGGNSSQGPGFNVIWSSPDGGFVNGQNTLQPEVDAPGAYTLTITNINNNCTTTSDLTVLEDIASPSISINPIDTLDCATSEVSLDASSSDQGPNFTYDWSTSGGNISSGDDTPVANVDIAATYQLMITNISNGCSQDTTVQVLQDTISPLVAILLADTLDCVTNSLILDASTSSQGNNFVFSWSAPAPQNIMNSNTLEPTVNSGGIYGLTIQNLDNSCLSTSFINVVQDTTLPIADAGPDVIVNCFNNTQTLDASNSSSANLLTFQWSGGTIDADENTLTPTVSQAGTFVLTVEDAINQCTATDTVVVSEDFVFPAIDIAPPNLLTCVDSLVTLDASNSSQGSVFQYNWSTPNGSIISGIDTPQSVASQSGIYILEISNTVNGCSTQDSVMVIQDVNFPIANIVTDDFLSCTTGSIQLDGNNSSQGSNYTFQWSTSNGNIVNGSNTLTPTVDLAGNYTLSIIDTNNDCEAISAIEVGIDTIAPLVDAGAGPILDCNTLQANLDGSGTDQGSNFTYQWTTTNGNIVTGANGLTPVIDEPGAYTLSVSNTINGCTGEADVTVTEDITAPDISITPPVLLTCAVTSTPLDASNSTDLGNPIYNWATADGTITSGSDANIATAISAGTYALIIVNEINGCADTASIVVQQDTIAPILSIAIPDTLNCQDTLLLLDANNSSSGPQFDYNWSTLNGTINSGGQSQAPAISAPGIYELEILNMDNGCNTNDFIEVYQDIVAPVPGIDPSDTLSCQLQVINLNGTIENMGAQSYTYSWSSGDGNIISGATTPTPFVDQPGTYTLLIQNLDNACVGETMITVPQDTVSPDVAIAFPDTLNCVDQMITLDGGASNNGFIFENEWSTSNGSIIGAIDNIAATVNEPGVYTLSITNTVNGCSATASIAVAQDTTLPVLAIAEPDTLNCEVLSITIDASNSSNNSNFSYQWESSDGEIIIGGQSLSPQVAAPGLYTLTISNLINGCVDSLSRLVFEDVDLPILNINPADILTCSNTALTLDGAGSSTGPVFNYQWTSDNGNITSAADAITAEIDAPGDYTLIITNTSNACIDSTSITVQQDTTLPIINIELPSILTCSTQNLQLDASNSSSGNDYSPQWNTDTGNIINNDNTLFPTIDSPGSYTLYIEDLTNGCIDSASVNVGQDIALPDVSIANPDTLTCAVQQLNILGETETQGVPLSFTWTTQDGAIIGATDAITTMINQPGTYTLAILNTENGCVDSTSTLVLQDTIAPTGTIDLPSILNCDVLEVALNSNTSVPVEYNWSSANGNILTAPDLSSIDVDAPGDYVLDIISLENGCETTIMVLVQQDTVAPDLSILTPDVLTCDLLEFPLDASNSSSGPNFEASWTASNGGNIVEGAESLNPLVDEPGNYQLTILNIVNGCSQSQNINVLEDVVLPTANAGNDFVLPCFEPSTNLDGSASSIGASFVYEWTTSSGSILSGSNSIVPVIDAPGLYNLLVTNTSNGCESMDMVQVIQDIPVASVSSVQPLCHDDNGQISISTVSGGISPYVYAIDGGESFFPGSNFTNLEPGNYDVVVQDVNGCEYNTIISIEQPDSVIAITTEASAELLFGESYQILLQTNIPTSEIQNIQWQAVPGLSCYDCLNPIASPNQTTDYRVVVTNVNGCSDEAFIRIFVDKGVAIYIPNIFSPNGDGSNDRFYLFAKAGTIETIENFQIYSRWGETLFEQTNIPPNDPEYGWDGTFRGQLMNSGVFTYFAKVKLTDGRVELFKGDVTLFR